MAESTLSLQFDQIRQEIARFFQFGRGPAKWTECQREEVNATLNRGIRQFLIPPPIQREEHAHCWSFLKASSSLKVFGDQTGFITDGGGSPVIEDTDASFNMIDDFGGANLVGLPFTWNDVSTGNSFHYTIVSVDSPVELTLSGNIGNSLDPNADTYTIHASGNYILPDDFGGIEGCITFQSRSPWPEITKTNEHKIRQLRADSWSTRTGRPRLYAVRPRKNSDKLVSGQAIGERYELMLWPIPNQTYILDYSKIYLVDAVSMVDRFPIGGMLHAETILASCLAIAESYLDPAPRVFRRQEAWIQRLTSSVMADRRMMSEDELGQNLDRSDDRITTLHDALEARNYWRHVQ